MTMALNPRCVQAVRATQDIPFLHILYNKECTGNDANTDSPMGAKGKHDIAKSWPCSRKRMQYSIQFRMVLAYIVSLDLCLVLC